MGVKHIINNGFSPSDRLRNLLRDIWIELHDVRATIVADYVAGAQNLCADTLSRLNTGDFYRLKRTLI